MEGLEACNFQIDGLEYQFSTENHAFYKNAKTVCKKRWSSSIIYDANIFSLVIDEHLGDIHAQIVDIEIEMSQKLQEFILNKSPILLEYYNIVGELDW